MRCAGLPEFVATDREGYVRHAVEWANDSGTPAKLEALRQSMRDRLRASAACDVQGFARYMEALYLRLWEGWLSRNTGQ
jgi:predicted O-linked N-acetylglucosamine transferase (SPINDLY family)